MTKLVLIGNFEVTKKLGQGSFGLVYEVINVLGEKFALKLETVPAKCTSQLKNEYNAYCELEKCKGIAKVYYFGRHDNHFFMVMDLMGPSLQDLYEQRNKKFSLKTICMIGITLLESLENIHEKHKIFRDIKPENILIGMESPEKLFLIDLGMAKHYRNPSTKKHIPFINNKKLTGTARYASLNTHLGLEQSRRDDLESLGYTLIYFLRSDLPWMGLKPAHGREKHAIIGKKKQETKLETLCSDIPAKKIFIKYMKYVRSLEFTDKPDYSYLINLLKNALKMNNLSNDKDFDWISRKYEVRPKKKKSLWGKIKNLMNVCRN